MSLLLKQKFPRLALSHAPFVASPWSKSSILRCWVGLSGSLDQYTTSGLTLNLQLFLGSVVTGVTIQGKPDVFRGCRPFVGLSGRIWSDWGNLRINKGRLGVDAAAWCFSAGPRVRPYMQRVLKGRYFPPQATAPPGLEAPADSSGSQASAGQLSPGQMFARRGPRPCPYCDHSTIVRTGPGKGWPRGGMPRGSWAEVAWSRDVTK